MMPFGTYFCLLGFFSYLCYSLNDSMFVEFFVITAVAITETGIRTDTGNFYFVSIISISGNHTYGKYSFSCILHSNNSSWLWKYVPLFSFTVFISSVQNYIWLQDVRCLFTHMRLQNLEDSIAKYLCCYILCECYMSLIIHCCVLP